MSVANSYNDMTDSDKIYIYTGNGDVTHNLVNGNWYYYNNSTWTAGGTYITNPIDATLTQTGKAADAAVTGQKINQLIKITNDIAFYYDETQEYDINDYVFYNNDEANSSLYKCVQKP